MLCRDTIRKAFWKAVEKLVDKGQGIDSIFDVVFDDNVFFLRCYIGDIVRETIDHPDENVSWVVFPIPSLA